jgi:hypothetical protein
VLSNEITKDKVYRLRIEKFNATADANEINETNKKSLMGGVTSGSQSIVEKHVFNGVDVSKTTRYLYDESSENVLSVYRQLLIPYLNDTQNYLCDQRLTAKHLLKCGSNELKKILFQKSLRGADADDATKMEANLAEFLNYIWKETMGDLQELFGNDFQLSSITIEQVRELFEN